MVETKSLPEEEETCPECGELVSGCTCKEEDKEDE